jgi:NitT/TauT family transport system substrate-binding protein
MALRIMPHGRLQEWVAEEKGYFAEEGLEYTFVTRGDYGIDPSRDDAGQVKSGAYETYEVGRESGVSCACHWVVNSAARDNLGKLVASAYSVAPGAIMVPPDSDVRRGQDLAGVEIGVGYHSGSHFATLQALEAVLPPDQVKLSFQGPPNERLDSLLERRVPAAMMWGVPLYIAEAFGFRKVLDATFMVAFLADPQVTDVGEVEKYLAGLRRAQMEIDLHLERYAHHHLKSVPEKYRDRVDVHAFGPGERIVFLPYTAGASDAARTWVQARQIFDRPAGDATDYRDAVLT